MATESKPTTPRFSLLTEACGGLIRPEALEILIAHSQWLRDDLRAELDTFMAEGRELFAPLTTAELMGRAFGATGPVTILTGDAIPVAQPVGFAIAEGALDGMPPAIADLARARAAAYGTPGYAAADLAFEGAYEDWRQELHAAKAARGGEG